MKEKSIVKGKYQWVPPEDRPSRLPGPKPMRKPELRRPLFWLCRDGDGLFFVNSSGETLDTVTVDGGGLFSVDEEVHSTLDTPPNQYAQIPHDSAVKVDQYDPFWDSDFIVHLTITITSKKQGEVEMKPPPEKGGIGECVLLWDTGEPGGRYVSIKKKG